MDNLDHLLPARTDQPVVLVAEDEPVVCNIIRIGLEAAGFFVLVAPDGEAALKLSRKYPGTIHGLLSDIVMPRLNGLELREQILRERPNMKVLLMSGTGGPEPVAGVPFLAKPFHLEELKTRVRKLLLAAVSPR